MNILIVSQCSKNALAQTRRILDQFAQRCGDRTWQTPITMAGLTTLRKMLKKTARKNTAVACHWIRGKNHSELMWIVGNASRFNAQGAVPTNTTSRNILRQQDENQWQTAEVISLLAGIAGLFHDFGKSNVLFQQKLQPKHPGKKSEPFRHEWISLRLFIAFIGNDEDEVWLARLQHATPEMDIALLSNLERELPSRLKNPFKTLKNRPVALAVAWLIVSHHRLPEFPAWLKKTGKDPDTDEIEYWLFGKKFNAEWNSPQILFADWKDSEWADVWQIKMGTPLASSRWCAKASNIAKRALKHRKLFDHDWLNDRFTSHIARLVLMLADHCYSASDPTELWQDKKYKAVANTDRETGKPKQKLDEHTIGVGHNAVLLAKRLPALRQSLPAISRMKVLKKRVTDARFRWQDKAYDLATSISTRSDNDGFFGVNMASTGCGKTFANARIMYGLSNERLGCRFSVALGLRTLTLQTGDAFKERLSLDSEDLAVLVGSQAVRQLHEQRQGQQNGSNHYKYTGSESAEDFFDSDQYLSYEGTLDDGPLKKWLQQSPRLHQLVSSPVLISTIDYLMPATDGVRGGKQIAPMLRLLTSDLVLDEPDDFGLEDLPALCRLVNWAGMLGSRVLLSSATLPPTLVQALFEAYVAGRKEFNNACSSANNSTNICCAWFDEFGAFQSDHSQPEPFIADHSQFVDKRIKKLEANHQPLRLGSLLPVSSPTGGIEDVIPALATAIHPQIFTLHQHHHTQHPRNNKTISIGLVRMANINPLVALAKSLLSMPTPSNYHLHFCVYHGQYPLLLRSNIESVIDLALNRTDPLAVWHNPTVINALQQYPEDNHVFIVLGTSVTEVGRDHDYDWAIAEPSSMRSLIQLAGRIQRHRLEAPKKSNLLIMSRNIKALTGEEISYCKPGFESKEFTLEKKDLNDILAVEQYQQVNAIPRIKPRNDLDYRHNLVDLEHTHLHAKLYGHAGIINASLWWENNPSWCGEIQRRTPFRKSQPEEQLILYLEQENEAAAFYLLTPDGTLIGPQNERFKQEDFKLGSGVSPWINNEIEPLIVAQAEKMDMNLTECSRRFTLLRLRESEKDWFYHPLLGVYQSLF